MKIVFEFPAFLAEMRIRSDNSCNFIKEVFIMFQYERMASVLPEGVEFAKCGNISLDDIQQEKFLKEWNQKHGKKKKN